MNALRGKNRIRALAALLLAVLLFAAGCGENAPAEAAPSPTPHVHSWHDGVCGECGAVCAHEWRRGVCAVCGKVCAHEWRLGMCTICGRVCRHEWRDGVCVHCGFACVHKWRDGVCLSCGTRCEHVWDDGVCTVCGLICPHERHGEEDLVCAVCGLEVPHDYRNGACSRCGRRPVFIDRLKGVPQSLATPAQAHGTTECYHYALVEGEILPGAHATVLPEERRQRDLVVYTPPGYDPAQRYNVVILSPGAGHNAHYWLERLNRLGSAVGRIEGRELLDRLIEQGIIEPLIVAAVEYYHLGTPEEISVSYGKDLRERVLPFLAAHYSTYASVGENGELIAAPEHFAFVGASFGSMIGWQLLPKNTDLFSYWGLLAGAYSTKDDMAAWIDEGVSGEHPIHWLYAGDGKDAQAWEPYLHRIEALDRDCSRLELDKNLSFLAVEDTSHSFSAWDIGLINSLQIFFLNRYEPAAD